MDSNQLVLLGHLGLGLDGVALHGFHLVMDALDLVEAGLQVVAVGLLCVDLVHRSGGIGGLFGDPFGVSLDGGAQFGHFFLEFKQSSH